VISGFALRFDQSFVSVFFFGWEGGFQLRGTIHRVAAVLFMGTVVWHVVFMITPRGRGFVRDMLPNGRDFRFFWSRILYNSGGGSTRRASSASATSRRRSTGRWSGARR